MPAAMLAANRIVLLSDPGSRDQVLDAAARLLSGDSPVLTQPIADALRAREAVGSTGIGRGVALPHCRNGFFREARAAFLRLAWPVDFGAGDGVPVDLVLAVNSPEDAPQRHLQALAEFAEQFSRPELREALRDARDLAALRAILLAPGDVAEGP